MEATGFVLAGGGSTRMGRDKALLPYRGTTLLKYVAAAVEQAAGRVVLIGDAKRYHGIGYPVYPDSVPPCGPMGGIYTALSVTATDWNLVVACDMPMLSAPLLGSLLQHASRTTAPCVAAAIGGRPEPLCAVYHRRCLPALAQAIADHRFKMTRFLEDLQWDPVALGEPSALANVNTPAEWAIFENSPA